MSTEDTQEVKVKRGRGRPKGSKNKPKVPAKTDKPETTILKKEEVARPEKQEAPKVTATAVTSKVKVVVTEDEPIVEAGE